MGCLNRCERELQREKAGLCQKLMRRHRAEFASIRPTSQNNRPVPAKTEREPRNCMHSGDTIAQIAFTAHHTGGSTDGLEYRSEFRQRQRIAGKHIQAKRWS